jgi:hypothetical protein
MRVRAGEKQDNELVLFLKCERNESKKSIQLHWKHNIHEELAGYVVYRKRDHENILTPISGKLEKEMFTDAEAIGDSECTYQIRAYSANGNIYSSAPIAIKKQK